LAVFSAMVGAPIGALVVASLTVWEFGADGAPAVRSGMVGAGAGGLATVGEPAEWAGIVAAGGLGVVGVGGTTDADGAEGGTGGLTGGAVGGGVAGSVAEGTAGGASAAFRVTRTVSFFKGTLEVCLEGVFGSLSLIRSGFNC